MKDALGNELVVGDTVHVKVGMEWIHAIILKIQNGGIAVTGVPNPKQHNQAVGVTPDALVLQVGIGFQSQPGSPQSGVLKVVAPNDVNSIIESSLKM